MKNLACLAVLACAAAGRPEGAAPQATHALAPIGPLGHWRGDDGATPKQAVDATGNGRHGTYAAGAGMSTEVPATKFPNTGSIQLDGAAGMVSIPDSPALQIAGDITIAFWKRKTAVVQDWIRLVGKGNGGQRNYGIWEYPGDAGQIKCQMYGPGGQSVLELDSPAGTPIKAWTHIVFCVSVNAAALYLNGAPVAHGMRNGPPGVAADPLTFGHAGYHAFFPGQIDDVRIYDRALSMSEIAYLAGGQGSPAAPTALAAAKAEPRQVELQWAASATVPPAGTATYYIVKRSAAPGGGHAVLASGLISTSFIDTKVEPGATVHYVVTAVNTGGESGPSNEIKIAVPAK